MPAARYISCVRLKSKKRMVALVHVPHLIGVQKVLPYANKLFGKYYERENIEVKMVYQTILCKITNFCASSFLPLSLDSYKKRKIYVHTWAEDRLEGGGLCFLGGGSTPVGYTKTYV